MTHSDSSSSSSTSLPVSPEYRQVMEEARDIARATRQRFCSAHVLLALFTVPNRAEDLLRAESVDEDLILGLVRSVEGEGREVIREIKTRSREAARGLAADQIECLHLLLAMSRIKGCLAYDLLLRSGLSIPELRRQAIAAGSQRRRPSSRRAGAPRSEVPPTPPPIRRSVAHGMDMPMSRPQPQREPVGTSPVARDDGGLDYTQGDAPAPSNDGGAFAESRPNLPTPEELAEAYEPPAGEEPPVDRYHLDPDVYPWLTSLGRNLTLLASRGKIDPLVGRKAELEEIIDIMGKRRANNPCLVGPPGVGKTAVVEGLARYLVDGEGVPPSLADRIIVELDVGAVLAGTQLRGSLSEKIKGLKEDVTRAEGQVVVFIDEIHGLVGAGAGGDGSSGMAGELKTALGRGEFPCIGATTEDEYARYIEVDPALSRRFQAVRIAEPSAENAVEILEGVVDRYEAHHQVAFLPEAIDACVRLSERYIRDRHLPDKAFSVLDLTGSRAARQGVEEVGAELVARVVADITGVPEERLLLSDRERLLRMEEMLGRRIIGHKSVLGRVSDVIRRNYAGFSSQRPMGSFLFLGPSGVGKTETAKALAEFLFGSADSMTRIDMSEYSESHAVARLVGAPPGYVGFEDGGQLTESVRRRPYHIVLLDEIEKAHGDVLQLLLQVLDEGHLTDSRGRKISFTNTVVILTSNLGGQLLTGEIEPQVARSIGFAAAEAPADALDDGLGEELSEQQEERADRASAAARAALPPELWNRIEERLVFQPLSRDEVRRIARLLLSGTAARLARERAIHLSVDEAVIDLLIESGGFDATLGARPMRQTIQRLIEAPLAERILHDGLVTGDAINAVVKDEAITFVPQAG